MHRVKSGEWSRSRYWLCHFLHNRHERPRIDWTTPPAMAAEAVTGPVPTPVALWLAWAAQVHAPSRQRLIAWAVDDCRDDPAYVQSLRLFVKEERHHAELIERYLHLRGLGGLTGRPRGRGRAALRGLVRPLGLRFELSLLLLTQVIALAVCRRLREHIGDADPALRGVLGQLAHDHRCHLAFHAERLTTEFADFNFVRRNLRRWRLRAMFTLTVGAVARRHRRLLATLDWPARQFAADCHRDFAAVLEWMVPYRREALLKALLDQRDQPYAHFRERT